MEWIWYIIAALGAGIGTGLAGLSAATVMVPVLIVLCPSFAGETGAYQATAIALASDILGSAVTTYTYAKHKNIDLKRGWIMLVCILGMCTVGSYVAFLVGNCVLSIKNPQNQKENSPLSEWEFPIFRKRHGGIYVNELASHYIGL